MENEKGENAKLQQLIDELQNQAETGTLKTAAIETSDVKEDNNKTSRIKGIFHKAT